MFTQQIQHTSGQWWLGNAHFHPLYITCELFALLVTNDVCVVGVSRFKLFCFKELHPSNRHEMKRALDRALQL